MTSNDHYQTVAFDLETALVGTDAGVHARDSGVYVIPRETADNGPVAAALLAAGYSFTADAQEGCPVLFTISVEAPADAPAPTPTA